jgi:hypothetical protein
MVFFIGYNRDIQCALRPCVSVTNTLYMCSLSPFRGYFITDDLVVYFVFVNTAFPTIYSSKSINLNSLAASIYIDVRNLSSDLQDFFDVLNALISSTRYPSPSPPIRPTIFLITKCELIAHPVNCAQIPFAQLTRCVFIDICVHDVELHFLTRCLRKNSFESGEQSFLSDVFHTTDKDTSTEERLDVDGDGDGARVWRERFAISSSVHQEKWKS